MNEQKKFVSGDSCPACNHPVQVVNTKIAENNRIRYIGCRNCGFRPENNRQTLPLEYAHPRRPQRRAS